MAGKVRILLLGAGLMGANHVKRFAEVDGAEVVAVADLQGADAFAKDKGIGRAFSSLDDALAWGEFDAVSNVTPDPVHAKTTLQALAAGKHVLCEKPLAPSYPPAAEMAAAAEASGLVHMVNLSYREVPEMRRAAGLVADGAIGEIRHFEASYLQSWLTQPAWGDWREEDAWLWRLSTKHGSTGVLGDVGVHILDFATFVAGDDATAVACRLKTFDKAPGDVIGDYTLDANDSAVMTVELAGGALGTIHTTRFASGHLNDLQVRVYGTKGGLDVVHSKNGNRLAICRSQNLETATWEELKAPSVASNYATFVEAVRSGAPATPDFHRGSKLQRALDAAIASDADKGRIVKVDDISA